MFRCILCFTDQTFRMGLPREESLQHLRGTTFGCFFHDIFLTFFRSGLWLLSGHLQQSNVTAHEQSPRIDNRDGCFGLPWFVRQMLLAAT